jgi:hypothetical protein
MELQDIYFVAEIVGVIAIVLSLVFVGIQVSQHTDATKISNAQAALSSWNDITLAAATNDGLLQGQISGVYPELQPYLSTDKIEAQTFTWLEAGVKAVEVNYLQWLEGNLSDDLWHGYRSNIIGLMAASKYANDFWSVRNQSYSVPFQALMNEVVQEATSRRAQMLEQMKAAAAEEG